MRVRIRHYNTIELPEVIPYVPKKGTASDDNIFTFDIETISLYNIEGKWQPFDYNRPPEFYEETDKAASCYLWQFGINDQIYYGRELSDFSKVLQMLYDQYPECHYQRYIYVHNLSYEMQWLYDLIIENGWTITELVARNLRQPISFKIEELNIYFRCSYMLTNLSLDSAAKKYTSLRKAVGELDYNIPYSPLSPLNKKVLHYGEMDCRTLYHIIEWFRSEYGHIKKIPLTQTGEVRAALRKETGFWYIKEQQKKVPTIEVYLSLMKAFSGGISHGNILFINRIIENCWGYDFCSSYPFALVAYEYPSDPFRVIHPKSIDKFKDTHCLLYYVEFTDLRSKYYNHYISWDKMKNVKCESKCVDNGRLVFLKGSCEMMITDVDFEIIKHCYDCKIRIKRVLASRKKRLDTEVVRFILQRYYDKTTLKGVEGQEEYYMKMKQQINSIFGMSCTNPLKAGIYLEGKDMDEWAAHDPEDFDFITEKLNDMRKSMSTLFFPMAIGCWCTAYARRNLWMGGVIPLDMDVAYYDTDSIKGVGDKVKDIVAEYNQGVDKLLEAAATYHDIPLEMFRPKDPKGIEHPLGYFENETEKGLMKQLKVLGSKKYYYVDHKGKSHLTMAGVRKSAVKYITIDQFDNGFVFNYKECGKLTHFYTNHQPDFTYTDVNGNTYTCKQKHAIILQPTTFTIGMTEEFMKLILKYQEGYVGDEY